MIYGCSTDSSLWYLNFIAIPSFVYPKLTCIALLITLHNDRHLFADGCVTVEPIAMKFGWDKENVLRVKEGKFHSIFPYIHFLWFMHDNGLYKLCISDTNVCDSAVINGYSGTTSTTGVHTCQRWDTQSPQSHPYNVASYFPDANLDAASNYCRNPSGSIWPWCYTTEPLFRYGYCRLSDATCRI